MALRSGDARCPELCFDAMVQYFMYKVYKLIKAPTVNANNSGYAV